jgi:hypothetical protein
MLTPIVADGHAVGAVSEHVAGHERGIDTGHTQILPGV